MSLEHKSGFLAICVVILLFAITAAFSPGCCARDPAEVRYETCLDGCQYVRDECAGTPGLEFDYAQCLVACDDPNGRVVNYPDCVPCFADVAECTARLLLERCVVECGLP